MALQDLNDDEYKQVLHWLRTECFNPEYCLRMQMHRDAGTVKPEYYFSYHNDRETTFAHGVQTTKYLASYHGKKVIGPVKRDFSTMQFDLPWALAQTSSISVLKEKHHKSETVAQKSKHAQLFAALIEAQCGFAAITEQEFHALVAPENAFSPPPQFSAKCEKAKRIYETRPVKQLAQIDYPDFIVMVVEALEKSHLQPTDQRRVNRAIEKNTPLKLNNPSSEGKLSESHTNGTDKELHADRLRQRRLEKRIRAQNSDGREF